MYIYGDFDSPKARLMEVQLIQCHNREDCKSPEEIRKFLKNKYLLILNNKMRFDNQEYGANKIVKESEAHWLPINTQVRMRLPHKISLTEV